MSKPDGEWNHVRIITKGRRIQITWNGEQTIDYETDRLTTGYIGLQNHDAKSIVRFRNIRITEFQLGIADAQGMPNSKSPMDGNGSWRLDSARIATPMQP